MTAPAAFDGTTWPQILVLLGFNGTFAGPSSTALRLGVGPGLGTATLGGITWVDVSDDVISIDITGGKAGKLETTTPGTCTLALDNFSGYYDPDNTAGPYSGELDVGINVWVRVIFAGTVYDRFYGFLDAITLDLGLNPVASLSCVDGLEALGRAYIPEAVPVGDGDHPDDRLTRILDAAGWPSSQRDLDQGQAILQATSFAEFALPMLQETVDSELGSAYVDGSGTLVFRQRWASALSARSTTVQAELTDTATDSNGEVEMVSLQATRSRASVFNTAAITRDDPAAVEQTAEDAASVALYGPRNYPRQVGLQLRDDGAALAMAQYVATRYREPVTDVSQVELDALALGLWATVLDLRRGDLITVTRDYGPSTLSAELLIYGIDEAIAARPPAWSITYATESPAHAKPLVLGGPYGLGTGQLGF